jgi:hypothetical protein
LIALILERDVAQSILRSLGRASNPPAIARARSPEGPAGWMDSIA